MILDGCIIALIGMGGVFAFLIFLIYVMKVFSWAVMKMGRNDLSKIAAAIAYAKNQEE